MGTRLPNTLHSISAAAKVKRAAYRPIADSYVFAAEDGNRCIAAVALGLRMA
jgi:hypothetical protein